MAKKSIFRLIAAVGALFVLALAGPNGAFAQPPNDDFAGATTISSLPFSTAEDTSQATWDASDPAGCSSNGSVWFAFTPSSNMQIEAYTFGSNYDTVLSAWTGTQGSLSLAACNDDTNGLQSRITFQASAGTTYYFMVAVCCGDGSNGGGDLQFSVAEIVPPGNDDFADATAVAALPFADTPDLRTATTEPGEPSPGCLYFGTSSTAWYSFTPGTTQSVTATTDQYGVGIGAYTGSSLASLSQVGCTVDFEPLTFRAQAGTTYWFQLAGCCGGFPATFRLQAAADPIAQFGYSPSGPSTFDTVQFGDNSYDPAGAGISSWAWDFGDGGTSTQSYPSHRYAADGDYTVRLTVTTTDGRSASTSQVVRVQTHDVSIVRLAVPKSAHVGQTIAVSVYVRNTHYPETVQVAFSKSVPGGTSQVGSLTQSVPVKTGGQSTRFAFTYTVTNDDKAVGKITFRADAFLLDHTDAFPADNTLQSTPVKVG